LVASGTSLKHNMNTKRYCTPMRRVMWNRHIIAAAWNHRGFIALQRQTRRV